MVGPFRGEVDMVLEALDPLVSILSLSWANTAHHFKNVSINKRLLLWRGGDGLGAESCRNDGGDPIGEAQRLRVRPIRRRWDVRHRPQIRI